MAKSTDTVSVIQDFYNSNKQKINDAYLCSKSNPCSSVIDDVESLIQTMKSDLQKISTWDDSISDLVKEGINTYVQKLESVSLIFSTTWLQAEKIYQSNYDLIIELGKYLNILNDSSDSTTLLKAREVMDDIESNFTKLNTLVGQTEISSPPAQVVEEEIAVPVDTYQGINIMTSSESEALAYLKSVKSHINTNSIGYTVRYKQASNHPWYKWTSKDGKYAYAPNCVIYSLATGLTSTLSGYYGHQVVVNPTQVMDGLYAYCQKHNIKFSKFITSGGDYSGDYTELPKALKEIWGVDCVGQKGAVSSSQAQQLLSGNNNASIVYRTYNSSGNPGHGAAATGLTSSGKFIVSDTYYSREGWVNGTENFGSVSGYNFILTK
ncbi:MAG: hypothetical protein IJ068_03505 [Bacilli bacterium]|nr:hypothetical protein [Bacilli bacterium]